MVPFLVDMLKFPLSLTDNRPTYTPVFFPLVTIALTKSPVLKPKCECDNLQTLSRVNHESKFSPKFIDFYKPIHLGVGD